MSAAVAVTVDISGLADNEAKLQQLRGTFAERSQMHAAMATDVAEFTREFLRKDARHATAQRLGARPTGFRTRAAKGVEAASDTTAAILRIRTATGLGRAFHDQVIVPGQGRTYLTIPASARTYGKGVRDFPEGTFKFAILYAHRVFPVLLFVEGGEVAYWLRRKVIQRQDRTLLPSDAGWREVAKRSAAAYVWRVLSKTPRA